MAILLGVRSAYADTFNLSFKTDQGVFEIYARDIRGLIWVDATRIATILGARTEIKKGAYVFHFGDRVAAVHLSHTFFSIKEAGSSRWKNHRFPKNSYVSDGRLMVPMESLPEMMGRTFSYHLQRKRLETQDPLRDAVQTGDRYEPIRVQIRGGKQWFSIDDLAKVLGLTLYSSQPQVFNLVLPDFSIVEMRVGENTVRKRGRFFLRLDDPPLLFSGSPYLSQQSVGALMGFQPRYDSKRKKVAVPARYGFTRRVQVSNLNRLILEGYRPEPFSFDLESWSAFYQEPEPSFVADHSEVYESVRDFLTNEPIVQQNSSRWDRVSAEGLASLNGNLFNAPFEGRGSFEKVGSRARVVNGTVGYGFPWMRVEGGREFVTMNGLNNQFNLVDQVYMSHSTDHFGDGEEEVNPRFDFAAGYGETEFSVFLSTELFTQTIDYRQKYTTGKIEGSWALSPKQHANLKLEHFVFTNEIKDVSAVFNDEEFLREILGDDFVATVDERDVRALAATVISDDHSTSFLNASYGIENIIELGAVGGLSTFKEPLEDNKRKTDTDYLGRLILGGRRSRLNVSYEEAGKNYRSLGSPIRYQDRSIFRASPYLDFGRHWKVFGEFRKEDSSVLEEQGIPPFTNKYIFVANQFLFSRNSVRASVTEFDSSLFGQRVTGSLDYSRLIGRHTVDLGGAMSGQWDRRDQLFRRGHTGRAGFTLLYSPWSLSASQEVTRDEYPPLDLVRYETQTNLKIRVKGFHALMQYEKEPRNFLEEERIYTGFVRLGHEVGQRKILNAFYASASQNKNLSDPEAWRAGLELVYEFQ